MRYICFLGMILALSGCETSIGVYVRKDMYIEGFKVPDGHAEVKWEARKTF